MKGEKREYMLLFLSLFNTKKLERFAHRNSLVTMDQLKSFANSTHLGPEEDLESHPK